MRFCKLLVQLNIIIITLVLLFGVSVCEAASMAQKELESVVTGAAQATMHDHAIPGMAIGITVHGKRYFFYYGVASKETGQHVNEKTLFEIGSLSKVFTGTLGGYAQARGFLSLSDMASKHFPLLAGTSFDQISLVSLGTYTPGGLPLQFPDAVDSQAKMLSYFQNWRPVYPPETYRRYSNPSIGLFGHIIAEAMGAPFEELMEKTLFPAFGLKHTYMNVPQAEISNYAYGYAKDDTPVRVSSDMFAAEAYGVKTTVADMLRFVEAHINSSSLENTMQQAAAATRLGVYSVGAMTQGLGWEMYAYPPDMDAMMAQSSKLVFDPQPVTAPSVQQPDMFLHKTGSTNGFGAYAALVPSKGLGLVILANKNYPNSVRMSTAAHIFEVIISHLCSE